MGTCVSRCYPCSSSSPSTAGDHSSSLCGGGSPALSHLHTTKHAVAVHPLPLASDSPALTTSTSSSSLLSAASSSNSMATSSSSATTRSYSSSSSSSRPGYLKVRTCRDMEVVVLDPNRNKKKLPRPASATPRPLLPRTPPALSVARSPTKKKPGTTSSNGRRTTTPMATAARRVRPLPPRAPPAGTGAGGSVSCRKKRLSPSSSSCRSADLDGRRKSGGATKAGAGGDFGGELVDDLNNPLISMDCFIFL